MYLEKEATTDVWALGSSNILVYFNVKLIIDIVTMAISPILNTAYILLRDSPSIKNCHR